MSNVLTIVFDKVEPKLDSVIAAAVNELHNIGHVVKEVRVMGDSGEAKIALNTVEGLLPAAAGQEVAKVAGDVTGAIDKVDDVLENKGVDGTSPVQHTSVVPDPALPVDVPPTTAPPTGTPVAEENTDTPGQQTIDQRRLALLEELDALDKEEEAGKGDTASTVDPTNLGESVLTNPDATPGS